MKKEILIGQDKSGNPIKLDKGVIAKKRDTTEAVISITLIINVPVRLPRIHEIILRNTISPLFLHGS